MDRLYLPAVPGELNSDAIKAVNRWRENELYQHELPHHARVRRVFGEIYRAIGTGSLAEIGCGKFPLGPDLRAQTYCGYDIDDEAVVHNSMLGIATTSSLASFRADATACDVRAGLFVMQFPLDDGVLDVVTKGGPADTILVFNLPTKDMSWRAALCDRIERRGLQYDVIDLRPCAVHDEIFIASAPSGELRRRRALDAAKRQAEVEWASLK